MNNKKVIDSPENYKIMDLILEKTFTSVRKVNLKSFGTNVAFKKGSDKCVIQTMGVLF